MAASSELSDSQILYNYCGGIKCDLMQNTIPALPEENYYNLSLYIWSSSRDKI
jgi:hypothetical protein